MAVRRIWSMERLGFFSKAKKNQAEKCIWLHGASVGEVNVLLPLINVYLQDPQIKIIVSTMTRTGQKYLLDKCGANQNRICPILLPLDFWFIWRRTLKTLAPKKIIIAETEIWPGFILSAAGLGIPIFLVNGRISDKSYSSYRKYRFLFSQLLKRFAFIYTQTEPDKDRFLEIGALPEKIKTIGNLKNDGLRKLIKSKLEPLAFFPKSHRVIFGSLRPKELDFAIESILKLKAFLSDMKIIICPRHFDWLEDLYDELNKNKITFQIASKQGFEPKAANISVLVIDQIGFLQRAYQNALSAFVGGTLFPEYGGHNCLEPAALGIPVFHGPHFLEQFENTKALLSKGGSKIVKTAAELVAETEKMIVFAGEKKRIAIKCLETVQMESRAISELKKDNFF